MDVTKLTHINYAFALVNDDSEIYFRDEIRSRQHLAQLQALKARNPDLKLLVSVGGWGADGFSDAALTDESRVVFSRSAVAMIRQYGLDGIDHYAELQGLSPFEAIEFLVMIHTRDGSHLFRRYLPRRTDLAIRREQFLVAVKDCGEIGGQWPDYRIQMRDPMAAIAASAHTAPDRAETGRRNGSPRSRLAATMKPAAAGPCPSASKRSATASRSTALRRISAAKSSASRSGATTAPGSGCRGARRWSARSPACWRYRSKLLNNTHSQFADRAIPRTG